MAQGIRINKDNMIIDQQGLNVWPDADSISVNTPIIIEGVGKANQAIVAAINSGYEAYLQSAGKKVNLKLKEMAGGTMDVTQAVMIPEPGLETGKTYELVIRKKQEAAPVSYTANGLFTLAYEEDNTPVKKAALKKWKVVASPEITATHNAQDFAPRLTAQNYEYIAGNLLEKKPYDLFVTFSYHVSTPYKYVIKANIENVRTGTKTTHYLSHDNTTLRLGYMHYYGIFDLGNTGNKTGVFDVSFELIDQFGNVTPWNGSDVVLTPAGIRYGLGK